MNRKLLMSIAVITFFVLSVGLAQATTTISVLVTSNGQDLSKVSSVPLNTHADVTVNYANSEGKPAAAILIIWFESNPSGKWSILEIPFAGTIGSDGKPFTKVFPFTFENPGYYKFTWAVANLPCTFKIVCAKVGPVLPEPEPLLGLAMSIGALGVVLTKKRFIK